MLAPTVWLSLTPGFSQVIAPRRIEETVSTVFWALAKNR